MADDIISISTKKNKWVNNANFNEDELLIQSKRIKENIGTHKIIYSSSIDNIEIMHEAKNREGFALGALIAAKWLVNKKGVFNMNDVLDDL